MKYLAYPKPPLMTKSKKLTASYNRHELGQLVYNLGSTVAAPRLEVTSASYKTDGFKKVRSSPLYLVRSGTIGNTSLSLIAKHSSYWSGSFSNYMGANTQSFTVSSFDSASNQHRGNGLSIRCIMRQN